MSFILDGLYVGHISDKENRTGCTAILCPGGAVGGVDVRGAAPGTRETDLLRPGNLVEKVHGVMLSGGSAYGLEAACGVMDYFQDHGIGMDVGATVVPIVPSAVLFDLTVGSPTHPDKAMGYAACEEAMSGKTPQWGRVGAGCGASVGKVAGGEYASDGGIGYAAMKLPHGGTILCICAVNAVGDVVDAQGRILAGMKNPDGGFTSTEEYLLKTGSSSPWIGTNTTIAAIVTDVKMDKAQANRLAAVAHDGYARAIHPVHTQSDGDTIFALSCGQAEEDFLVLCTASAMVTEQAIRNAVTQGDRT